MCKTKWSAGLFSLVTVLATATHVPAETVRYGDTEPFPGNSGSLMFRGYLSGPEIAVPQSMTLTGVGVIFNSSGPNAKVGVYADDAGSPGALLAQTGDFAVTSTGRVEMPVLSPIPLSPGRYWFEAVYDNAVLVGANNPLIFPPPVANTPICYTPLNFSEPLPAQFPVATSELFHELNYYLIGTVVPEPCNLALLGTAALSMLTYCAWRSRRRGVQSPSARLPTNVR